MRRLGFLTSGGDCQALNAAMRGVVKCLANSGEEFDIVPIWDSTRSIGVIQAIVRSLETGEIVYMNK